MRSNPPLLAASIATAGAALVGWQLLALHAEVRQGHRDLDAIRTELETERKGRAAFERAARDLAGRAEALSAALSDARAALDRRDSGVEHAERRRQVVEEGLADIRTDLSAQSRRLDHQGDAVSAMGRRLESVAPSDYTPLLGPTVKISSKSDVGSGTVVFSRRSGEAFTSYVLTAHHIVEQNCDPGEPLPLDVISFQDGQKTREERGTVVAAHPGLDLALVEVRSARGYEAVARLVPPARVGEVKVYARVCAMGCPLGYAPTPTTGELTSKSKVLDGQTYWMINAPTIFGNSGGGIYLADSGEMIGVLSRISAYKNLIDVAVPHMGIMTSMSEVYAWLDQEHYRFVYDPAADAETAARGNLGASAAAAAGPAAAVTNPVVPASAAAMGKK